MLDAVVVRPRDFIVFGPFRLFPAERLLEKDGAPVQLGSRALDILLALIERAGDVVANNDLMAQVWRDVTVEEGSLRVHIAALRKALGDDKSDAKYIKNVPGRGYCFVAAISSTGMARATAAPAGAAAALATSVRPNDLPGRSISTIGREEVIHTITGRLSEHRFVTIVGAGGIGKTTVALAVAKALAPSFDGAVCFVDLAPLNDPRLVPMALASKFGLPLQSDSAMPGLIGFLRDKRMLIVLDSCEPVIETTAVMADQILRGAPHVHILATSRESLRVDGEHIHRLFPLQSPPDKADLTAAEAMTFPAVQLFVERAEAALDSFSIDDATAPTIADICRRLDGIPLAIELAAARVDFVGVQGIATGLTDLFSLLTKGRRTALPRHQTLRATLDWSYRLLSRQHQRVLERLAAFRGQFALESAIAITVSPDIDSTQVVEGIAKLVATSLLATELSHDIVRYRLLDTTRAYAVEKLAESGEASAMAQRHASYCQEFFATAESDWEVKTQAAWLEKYGGWIDDLRAALDWAFGLDGDPASGIALTTDSAPLWFVLWLVHEYHDRAEHALEFTDAASLSGSVLEMRLNVWLAAATFNAKGSVERTATAAARALEIAIERDLPIYESRALWQLAGERHVNGDYAGMLAYAERFERLAVTPGGPGFMHVRDRLMALGLHLVGRQGEARPYAERAVSSPGPVIRNAHTSLQQYDSLVASRIHLSRVLWLQGLSERAVRTVEDGLQHALTIGYPPTICYILAFAVCPIAFWTGNREMVVRNIQLLKERSADISFVYWQSWWRWYEQTAALGASEDTADFEQRVQAVLQTAGGPTVFDMLGTLREELAGPDAVSRAETGQSGWCAAEILRARGANILRQNRPDAARRAEVLFLRAIDMAAQQDALSWELRGATSLARLWQMEGRQSDAKALLERVYGRVTEGFDSVDPLAAKRLLVELA
jgi:predicted ATPase/DNA-binding winged helix-turn-helix (wHTH) protein